MDHLVQLAEEQLRSGSPEPVAFRPGDVVRVHERVAEASGEQRERVQVFEGVVVKREGGGLSATFTVRKVSWGVGVEKTWPLHSPKLVGIERVARGRARRAKLTYLRRAAYEKSS